MEQTKPGSQWKAKLKSIDSKIIDSVVKKIVAVSKMNMIKFSVIALPSKNRLFTVLKSPFIYKTARDQYFLCEKKRVIYLYFKAGQSIDLFRNIDIPSAVSIDVSPVK